MTSVWTAGGDHILHCMTRPIVPSHGRWRYSLGRLCGGEYLKSLLGLPNEVWSGIITPSWNAVEIVEAKEHILCHMVPCLSYLRCINSSYLIRIQPLFTWGCPLEVEKTFEDLMSWMEAVSTCSGAPPVDASRRRHKTQETSLHYPGLLLCLEASPCFNAISVGAVISMEFGLYFGRMMAVISLVHAFALLI